MRTTRCALRVLLLAILAPSHGSAIGLYVDGAGGGCGGNVPCYATIQEAVNAASGGDVIQVMAGTYQLDNDSPIRVDKGVTLIGDVGNPGNVVIRAPLAGSWQGRACGFVLSHTSGTVIIKGFTIRDAPMLGGNNQNAGIWVGHNGDTQVYPVDNAVIENNVIDNCANGIALDANHHVTIRSNLIRNALRPAGTWTGTGIVAFSRGQWRTCDSLLIEGNTIEDNARAGITLENAGPPPPPWGPGGPLDDTRWYDIHTMILGNTIENNGGDMSDVGAGMRMRGIQAFTNFTGVSIVANHVGRHVSSPTNPGTSSGLLIYGCRGFRVLGNDIVDNHHGVRLDGSVPAPGASTEHLVEGNLLRSNIQNLRVAGAVGQAKGNRFELSADVFPDVATLNVANTGPAVFDASGNFYGSADPGTFAETFSESLVDYTPWLAAGTLTSPGFSGDVSAVWVDDDSPQCGPVERIPEGVGLVYDGTVHVEPGSYAGAVDLHVDNLSLAGPNAGIDPCTTVRGPEAVLWSSDPNGTVQVTGDGATIDGLTVTGGVHGFMVREAITGMVVRNVIVDGPSIAGINLGKITSSLIERNKITNCPSTGIGGGSDNSDQPTSAIIQDNCIDNTRLGITGYHSGSVIRRNSVLSAGMLPPAAGIGGQLLSTTISSNTVSGYTHGAAIALTVQGERPPSSNVAIVGNEFAGNECGIFFDAAATLVGVTAHQNLIHGNTVAGLQNLSTAGLDASCNWWGSAQGPNVPPHSPSPGDDLVGSATYAPWWTNSNGPCDGYGPNHVTVSTLGLCLSTTHPCVNLPVVFTRADTTPARGASVTIQLSDNLELCGTIEASIHQGDWLTGYGTTFRLYDLGGGRYTVDQAIPGLPCGVVTGGTLFTVDVKKKTGQPDGAGSVTVTSVTVRDCSNAPLAGNPGAPGEIGIDYTPPVALAGLMAQQQKLGNDVDGTTKVNVSFTPPSGGGYSTTEVYRKGFGNYPEYDDPPGGGVPSVPATPAAAIAAGWALAGSDNDGVFADETTVRDFYYYVAFSMDDCENVSAVSNRTTGTLNYHLGDISNGVTAGVGNNQVFTEDISLLGSTYGKFHGDAGYLNYADVGPTTNYSVNARPTTDNLINFDDLMMFAVNYLQVSARGPAPVNATRLPVLQLAWELTGPGAATARLRLERNEGTVKGIHALIVYDRAGLELVGVAPGALSAQESVFFKELKDLAGVVVDAAMLGEGASFSGNGDVAILQFRVHAGNARALLAISDLRGMNNEFLGTSSPVVPTPDGPLISSIALVEPVVLGARPNPFSDRTEIRFRLAAERPVTLRIFDPAGRLVRTLAGGAFSAGEYGVIWDGCADAGRSVGSGVYFYTLDAGSSHQNRKLLLRR